MSVTTYGPVAVWDGVADSLRPEPLFVRVEGGHISRISADPATARGGEGREESALVALPGCTLLPGLIDAHVHLCLDPALMTPADQEKVGPEALDLAMAERAAAMGRAGITTARDLGGGRHREIALRDRIARGELPGPRLLCVGQPLTSVGGHCHFWGGEVADAIAMQDTVRRQVAAGADWIKVMATGGVFTKGTQPGAPQFSQADLRTIVLASRAAGRDVAAHCHGTEGIRRAVRAGVRTVEHCSFAGPKGFGTAVEDALVRELAERPVWVSPTVSAGWGRRIEKDGAPTKFYQRMSGMLHRLRDASVSFIASTDAGIPGVQHHQLPIALRAFSSYAGLSPVQTLRTATSHAAEALGIAGITGRVAPGLAADLLVVEGNPLADLAALERVRLVLARGRVLTP